LDKVNSHANFVKNARQAVIELIVSLRQAGDVATGKKYFQILLRIIVFFFENTKL